MKVRTPKTRNDLSIRDTDYVLEVGGGHNPHFRANVVVDKFADSNYHRSGDLRLLKGQKFVEADGCNLPFGDKEFDFVICNQVLEHVDDPAAFLLEQFRVARCGYIETPSIIGEYLFPKESHQWLLHEHEGVVYIVSKKDLPFVSGYDMGELFLNYLPKHSIGFKVLQRTHPNIFTMRIEWKDDFRFEINPTSPEILKYFKGCWDLSWAHEFFPRKSLAQEFVDAVVSYKNIAVSTFKTKLLKKRSGFDQELIGTSTLGDSLRCAAMGGSVCMTGILAENWSFTDFAPMDVIPATVNLTVYDSGQIAFDAAGFQRFLEDVVAGLIVPNISRVFSLDEIVEAHEYMEGNSGSGKIVVLT